MRRFLAMGAVAGMAVLLLSVPALASSGKGLLFHDGSTVRTVVVPSPLPGGGTDPFYSVTNGAEGQLGIAGVAPGDGPYHGGAWAVSTVRFNPGVPPNLPPPHVAVF